MFRTDPLFRKLAYQLVPAALVTVVGVLLLSSLGKTPDTAPLAASVETPINGDAVFKATPREPVAEADQDGKRVKAPAPAKTAASTPLPPRKPAAETAPRQVASAPPLPVVTIPEQPRPATPASEGGVMGTLRNATTTVVQFPQRAVRSVTGWFADSTPPRPPAPIPTQNYQASM